ncbi:hypothetical protein JR316_0013445 [Psilocybe cubensis]|uniref:Uncharacterized protein n=2 Tax=Psilocybe cubensis TaxID=181762 RepID=A0A8H7XLU5_PSICU|nr:uncharacterized protein JR316_0013445 [Psilocybe cubensis]KAH9474282.1 hypothetical protein JR316_0013445 [Psilocybe cubensis]
MSHLPPAPKDISTHPAKGSVVDPVDKAAKDADVDRKIRLYTVLQAFRAGKLPSNAQIDRALAYLLSSDALSSSSSHAPTTATTTTGGGHTTTTASVNAKSLSPQGRRLIQDLKEIISTARLMIAEKNADELVQDFVWHTRGAATASQGENGGMGMGGALKDKIPVDREKVDQDSEMAVKHLRTLLTLILSNSEVRKLLGDFSVIGRDLLARAASNASQAIAPPREALERVDETAPNDQFITEGGRVAAPGETPVLKTEMPGGVKIRADPHDDAHGGARVHTSDHPEGKPVGEVYDQAQSFKEQARSGAMDAASQAVRDPTKREEMAGKGKEMAGEASKRRDEGMREVKGHVGDVQESEDPDMEVEKKKGGVMGKMRAMRDNINERIPDKHKDAVSNRYERGRQFLNEEYFPEERRDQFIFRGKKVIIECQKHDDYQESIKWLLGFVEEYVRHGKSVAGPGGVLHQHVGTAAKQSNLDLCIAELRTILERFANGVQFDIVTSSLDALIDDARRDPALREWFSALNLYVRKVLLEPGYVLEPACNSHARKLRDIGREFYDGKYKGHFDALFDSVGRWFGAMGEDPINKQFGQDWARLTKDLLFDSEGSLKFKPELWNDIRKVILPGLIDQIGYIPIPRVEYTDDALDLVVENLTLQGRNLLPNMVSFEANNYVAFSPYNAIKEENHHRVRVHLEQIQADMRDVAFYYKKKTGIPKMKDSGLADVVIGGEGLSAMIELVSTPSSDRTSVFKVHDIKVKLDTLKFAIRDSNHDFLYKTLRPLATGLIKKQVQRAVADALRTGLEYLDGRLVVVRDRMEDIKGEEGEGRVDVLKDLFARKKDEAASLTSSAKERESASQFKIVADKRNSILADQGNPAGWVNRAEERKEMVGKGVDGWRSDAFHVVDNTAGVKHLNAK